MQDFAAIDFETANERPSSVCAVGIVVVRRGVQVDSYSSLIRPEPNNYNPRFTENIHGISYEDTINERPFPEVWEKAAPRLAGLPLVAHNSVFDEGCLRAAHELYGLPYPSGCRFYCTCLASRRVFGKKLPNHQLLTVAEACGYDLKPSASHTLGAAKACAAIALRILTVMDTYNGFITEAIDEVSGLSNQVVTLDNLLTLYGSGIRIEAYSAHAPQAGLFFEAPDGTRIKAKALAVNEPRHLKAIAPATLVVGTAYRLVVVTQSPPKPTGYLLKEVREVLSEFTLTAQAG